MTYYYKVAYFLLLLLPVISPAQENSQSFSSQNLTFINQKDTLAATLLKPEHPFAAVVLVHGSGQEKRMIRFATLLAQNGIAVLTYDKRGVAESGGTYAGPEVGTNNIDSANLNLLSVDASVAVDTLLHHLSSNQIPVGLLGASQAGWIIPLAAKKNSNVRFMVIFSGALITAREQLRFQFYTQGKPGFWDSHTEEEARWHISNDPDKYQFADTDPQETLSKLSIPGLWIFGGKDVQVPVRLSMEHLDSLKSGNKLYNYKLFPALDHNTAFSKDQEPVKMAIEWIKALSRQ
ncbi:alpha/beta hydrolase family protein [Polluticaenibacter yanchengensis]|uniref:Alpha/beta hydrolase n=1 Tax=Polluticaenibacter yanchengensis TaxID=3014562 RepID=A0ABT4UMQ5_9BACT|nr:alpha/beta hydrolase [Chitinophagaceae bacterium LY-5]